VRVGARAIDCYSLKMWIFLLGFLIPASSLSEMLTANTSWEDEAKAFQSFYERQFLKYKVPVSLVGAKGKLQWRKIAKARKYRTSLMEAWDEAKQPNFAGRYLLIDNIGCGTGCRVVFVADWKTGELFPFPNDTYVGFRKDSSLIAGVFAENCSADGPPLLFNFKGGRFIEVKHEMDCRWRKFSKTP
jgi:hypothetical protein